MLAHFLQFLRHTNSMCTLVTLISTLTEIFILRRMKILRNFIMRVNGLISLKQAKIISKAAHILCESDAHDELFYRECAAVMGEENDTVKVGKYFAIVKLTKPATTVVNVVTHREVPTNVR